MARITKSFSRASEAIGRAFLAILRELRDALREHGEASLSRQACAAIVASWCFVFVRTSQIPDRTEQAAILVAALYGSNQFKQAWQGYWQLRQMQNPPQSSQDQGPNK